MKKYFTLFAISLFSFMVSFAQSQPKVLKKLRLAQVSITTYDANGTMRQGQGLFIDEEGSVMADYSLFKGAVKAIVTDRSNNTFPVTEICGASSLYDIVKVRVDKGKKKLVAPSIASSLSEGTVVYVMPSTKADIKTIYTEDTISKVEFFNEKYHYVTLKTALVDRLKNSPVLDAQGQLVGIVQLSHDSVKPSYVIDANFAKEMTIKALDVSNADLKEILIKKALPEKEEDASSFLFLSARDTLFYPQYIEDFIRKFPQSTMGYVTKGEYLMSEGRYQEAEQLYADALNADIPAKDELHYSLSKGIYLLCADTGYVQYADWDLDRSLLEAQRAYDINPLPAYTYQMATCLYAQRKYQEAQEKYLDLTKTNMRSPDLFMYAAQCQLAMQTDSSQVIALMDSALACYPSPRPVAAARHVLVRAYTLGQFGKYREAVAGYNEYEHLMAGNLNANFYYEREQMEVKSKMYHAALNDIERAIKLLPEEPLLYLEAASLNFRVGQLDEAIAYAQKATELDSDYAEAYRILGVCQNQKAQDTKDNKLQELARKNLSLAKEKGDEMAESILNEMQ